MVITATVGGAHHHGYLAEVGRWLEPERGGAEQHEAPREQRHHVRVQAPWLDHGPSGVCG